MNTRTINTGQRLSPSARKIIKLRARAFQQGGSSLELQIPTNYIRGVSRTLNYDVTKDVVRRNLFNFSEDFANPYWSKTNVNISTGIVSPFGNTNAIFFNETGTTSLHDIFTTNTYGTLINGTTYTLSVYVKSGVNRNWCFIGCNLTGVDRFAYFNTSTGLFGTVNPIFTNPTAILINNGWYRITLTFVATVNTAIFTGNSTGDGINSYTGVTGNGMYFYGTQVEQGPTATPYQKTTTDYIQGTSSDDGARLIMTPNTIGEGKLFNAKPVLNNLAQRSEEIDNVYWTKFNLNITANATNSPDGNLTADLCVPNTTISNHRFHNPSLLPIDNKTYTYSIYAKPSGYNYILFSIGNKGIGFSFNISTGVINGSEAGATASITSAPNGFYRCSVTISSPTSSFIYTYISPDGTINNIAGDGTSGVYVWGAQLEVGSTATPYQRTTDGIIDFQATRATTATVTQKDGSIGDGCYNVFQFSEQFDNAIWVKGLSSITANIITDPNGNLTADKIVENTSSGNHFIEQSNIFPNNITATFSVFAKAAERNWLMLDITNNSTGVVQMFDLTNGVKGVLNTSGTDYSNISTNMVSVGNGWYLCSITYTKGNFNSINRQVIGVQNANSSNSYTGDGTSGLYIWGAQLTLGSILKPYLKTTNRLAVPSIDYSLGSNLSALLVEPQRTNIILQSETITDAAWNKPNAPVTLNSNLNPFGITKSYYIKDSTSNTAFYLEQLNSITTGLPYTASFYVKKADQSWCQFAMGITAFSGNVWANFNFDTGTFGFIGTTGTWNAKQIKNGYWLITATANSIATGTNVSVNIIGLNNSNTNARGPVFTGTSSNFCDIAAIQFEQGSNPTSYIPTTTATVTRNAYTSFVDLWNGNLLNKDNFTLYFEGQLQDGTTTNVSVALSDTTGTGTRANDLGIIDGIKASYCVGGTITSDTTSLSNGSNFKFCIQINGTSVKFFRNGSQIWSTQTIASFDYRYLVVNTGGSTYSLKKIALWKHTKSDADCITLTT